MPCYEVEARLAFNVREFVWADDEKEAEEWFFEEALVDMQMDGDLADTVDVRRIKEIEKGNDDGGC